MLASLAKGIKEYWNVGKMAKREYKSGDSTVKRHITVRL